MWSFRLELLAFGGVGTVGYGFPESECDLEGYFDEVQSDRPGVCSSGSDVQRGE